MNNREVRDPRFAELDRLIESRGERVHRLEPGGVMRAEMKRIRRRRENVERRQKYLREFSWAVFLNPKPPARIYPDSRSGVVDGSKDQN